MVPGYVKLIDNNIEYAQDSYVNSQYQRIKYTTDELLAMGYKPLYIVHVGDADKFKKEVITYSETADSITQTLDYVDMTDEEVIEAYPVQTQLDLYRSLEKLGQAAILDEALKNAEFFKQWTFAQEINLNDPVFKYALQNLGLTDAFLVQIIKNIDTMILNGELEG